jgi:hypothetical protein
MASRVALMAVLRCQGFADGVVEGERPLQHGVTGGVDDKGFIPSPWPVL